MEQNYTEYLRLLKDDYNSRDVANIIKQINQNHKESLGKFIKTFPEQANAEENRVTFDEAIQFMNAAIDYLKTNVPAIGERGANPEVIQLAKLSVDIAEKIEQEKENNPEFWKNAEKCKELTLENAVKEYEKTRENFQEEVNELDRVLEENYNFNLQDIKDPFEYDRINELLGKQDRIREETMGKDTPVMEQGINHR